MPQPPAQALAAGPPTLSPDAEGRNSVNLRVGEATRRLIDQAAGVLGKTRTEFMVESARRRAVDVLLDQKLFALDPDRYDAFLHALDVPPDPGPRLHALVRRTPGWRS